MKGWRTFAFSAAVAALGAVQTVQEPTDMDGWVTLGIAVIMAVLRVYTTTPPGKGTS